MLQSKQHGCEAQYRGRCPIAEPDCHGRMAFWGIKFGSIHTPVRAVMLRWKDMRQACVRTYASSHLRQGPPFFALLCACVRACVRGPLLADMWVGNILIGIRPLRALVFVRVCVSSWRTLRPPALPCPVILAVLLATLVHIRGWVQRVFSLATPPRFACRCQP